MVVTYGSASDLSTWLHGKHCQVPSSLPGAGELGIPALDNWVLLQVLEGEKADKGLRAVQGGQLAFWSSALKLYIVPRDDIDLILF